MAWAQGKGIVSVHPGENVKVPTLTPGGRGHSNSSLAPVMLDRISSSGTRERTQNCSGVAWDLDLGQHLDLGLGGRAQSSSSNSTAPALENQCPNLGHGR